MNRESLTAGRIAAFACPAGKSQAFLWDTQTPALAVRATPSGRKTYIFETRLNGDTLRMTIGDVKTWTIQRARAEASEKKVLVDRGIDPRELAQELIDARAAKTAEEIGRAVTVADAWLVYMAEGKPRKKVAWKPRYVSDLMKAAAPGGEPKKRGGGFTKPGHIAPLMLLRLVDIDQDAIRDWYAYEQKRAPVQAARAVAMFSGFLSWCATRKEYRDLVDKTCARASELGDILPPSKHRTDALEPDQLPAWFAGTNKLRNQTAAAYLRGILLTGARREELAGLRWTDVDCRWKKLTIADKVDAQRVIPLTPYIESMLVSLPRVPDNPFVFASKTSASGRIVEPRGPHAEVLADAGIDHVSIHGLRRSFALFGEAAGAPAGAIAQVMGHKPSALAERYKPRSMDALRQHLTQVEAFILARAGIAFDPVAATKGDLRLVSVA